MKTLELIALGTIAFTPLALAQTQDEGMRGQEQEGMRGQQRGGQDSYGQSSQQNQQRLVKFSELKGSKVHSGQQGMGQSGMGKTGREHGGSQEEEYGGRQQDRGQGQTGQGSGRMGEGQTGQWGQSQSGQKALGEVADLILDSQSGEVRYALLTLEGGSMMGGKMTPVPVDKISASWKDKGGSSGMGKHGYGKEEGGSMGRDSEGRSSGNEGNSYGTNGGSSAKAGGDTPKIQLTTDLDAKKLKEAPQFEEKALEGQSSSWTQEVSSFFGSSGSQGRTAGLGQGRTDEQGRSTNGRSSNGRSSAGTQTASSSSQKLARISKLVDGEIQGGQNEEVATIEDLAIDPQSMKVAFVMVSTGGLLGMGSEKYALPVNAIQHEQSREGKMQCTTSMSEDEIKQAPKLESSKWNEQGTKQFADKVKREVQTSGMGGQSDPMKRGGRERESGSSNDY